MRNANVLHMEMGDFHLVKSCARKYGGEARAQQEENGKRIRSRDRIKKRCLVWEVVHEWGMVRRRDRATKGSFGGFEPVSFTWRNVDRPGLSRLRNNAGFSSLSLSFFLFLSRLGATATWFLRVHANRAARLSRRVAPGSRLRTRRSCATRELSR